MRYQDQQLREILDAVRYPVDPKHEAAFRAILLDDKRQRRRNLLWLCICGLGILAGGYGLATATRLFPAAERAIQKSMDPGHSTFRSASSTPGETLSTPGQSQSSAVEADNTDLPDLASGSSAASSTTTGSDTDHLSASNQGHHTTLSDQNAGKQSRRSGAAAESGKSKSSRGQSKTQNASTIGGTLDNGTTDATSTGMEANPHGHVTQRTRDNLTDADHDQNRDQSNRLMHDTDLLSNNSTTLETDVQVADANEIIPSVHRVHKHRIHYGLSLGMYPAGTLFQKSAIKTGFGYQVGGFATYRLNARTQVRAEAGFAKLDGGFSYVKQSSSQQFGFSVLNQNHTLEIEKLYSGYVSAEIGLIDKKNIFSIGIISQYLYGARGYIETREHGQVETPVITTIEDVWLSTRDIPNLSLHGTLGMRSKLSRRLELGALIRIPIVHTLRKPSNLEQYQYSVKSHGVSPQVSLSYQLNQQ